MKWRVALIGGTGVGSLLQAGATKVVHVPTRYGQLRASVLPLGDDEALLVNRHGIGHRYPPHRVNYHAIVQGLRNVGVEFCFASAAVGSLRADWPSQTLAICGDFLDFTGRTPTLYDRRVKHVDFTHPFGAVAGKYLVTAANELDLDHHRGAVYVCMNGPRYETPHEVRALRRAGGDVVGMTAATEAILCREAGIEYACAAYVTNLGTGLADRTLTHDEVTEVMSRGGRRLERLLRRAAELALADA